MLDAIRGENSVEAGPEEPEEEGAREGEDIAGVRGRLIRMVLALTGREPTANSDSEIATEHVDRVSSSNVNGLKVR